MVPIRLRGKKTRRVTMVINTQMVSPPDTPLTTTTTTTTTPPRNNPPTVLPFATVAGPQAAETNSRLEDVALRITQGERPANTSLAYDPKEEEWRQYCRHVYPHNRTAEILNKDRVYRFLFYQCFREMKKRGGRRGGGRWAQVFDTESYDSLMRSVDTGADQLATPCPRKGLAHQAIAQYKAVLKNLYRRQVVDKVQALPWELIWTARCDELVHIVKTRLPKQKKANYEEKVDHAFDPYNIVQKYPDIEEKLWEKGLQNTRSAVTQLRNRYVLLHTTSGILRFESLQKAELSDFLAVEVKKEQDSHALTIMVTQLATGK